MWAAPFPDVTQQQQELAGDPSRMVFYVRYFLCCSVLVAIAMHLVVDGRATINAGCGDGNGAGLSSEAVQLENRRGKEEGLRPLDSAGTSLKRDLVSWEMRWVPSGPDPLHHNSNPKKPQTP